MGVSCLGFGDSAPEVKFSLGNSVPRVLIFASFFFDYSIKGCRETINLCGILNLYCRY